MAAPVSAEQFHDAQKTLADLRDHLARHDTPIAFLFGAGTSSSVLVPGLGGKEQSLIPAVPGLTAACKKDGATLGGVFEKAWELIEVHCKDAKQVAHVENVLSRLRMMMNAVGKDDALCGLKAAEIGKLEESVRKTIARIATPDLKSLPEEFHHRKFARWLAKSSRRTAVEVFTVNYDVLIEHALELERVAIFDGFVGSYQPFFHPDSLRRAEMAPAANWTRLWKMHGSVTWQRIEQDGRFRVIRGQPNVNGEMILPSFQKYDESRQQPYSAFAERLVRFLEQDGALLVVGGFSFGDDHINNLIFGALESRPRTHVYALQFEDLPEDSALIKRAYQRSNLIVVCPETGVIGGRREKWAPVDVPSFMDGVFELKEIAGTGGAGKAARLKIGDFGILCRFLESMAS